MYVGIHVYSTYMIHAFYMYLHVSLKTVPSTPTSLLLVGIGTRLTTCMYVVTLYYLFILEFVFL